MTDRASTIRSVISFLGLPPSWAEVSIREAEQHDRELRLSHAAEGGTGRNSAKKRNKAFGPGSANRAGIAKSAKKLNRAISKGKWRYYNTYRGNDFDPNLWKKTLPRALVRKVEENAVCKNVLEYLEYRVTNDAVTEIIKP